MHARALPATCNPCALLVPAGGMDQAISIMGMPGIAKLVEFNPVGGWVGWGWSWGCARVLGLRVGSCVGSSRVGSDGRWAGLGWASYR